MSKPAPRNRAGATLALVSLVVAGIWLYAFVLYVPVRSAVYRTAGILPASSDFYVYWAGARELLYHGRDPYSAAVMAELEQHFYGRTLTAADQGVDEHRFAYPIYMAFLIAPLAGLPFDALRPLLHAGFLLLIGFSAIWWFQGLGGHANRRVQAGLFLLGISSIPAIEGIIAQQPTALVAAALAGSTACLVRGRAAAPPAPGARRQVSGRAQWYAAAGLLLAIATVKPHLSGIPIVWLLAWAATDLRRRGAVWLGFGLPLSLAVAAGSLLVPGWVGEWGATLLRYQGYVPGATVPQVWLPAPLVPIVLTVLGLGLALYLWRTRRAEPGSTAFSLGIALTALGSVAFYPAYFSYNQVLLYPAALLVVQQRPTWQALGRAGRLIYVLTVDTLIWPWFIALLLLGGLLGAAFAGAPATILTIAAHWDLPWIPTLVPVVLLIPLAWLAWRAGRAPPPGGSALADHGPAPRRAPPGQ